MIRHGAAHVSLSGSWPAEFVDSSPYVHSDVACRWVLPVLRKRGQNLEPENMPEIAAGDECVSLAKNLQRTWFEAQRENSGAASLTRALFSAFGKDYLVASSVLLIQSAAKISMTQGLGALIEWIEDDGVDGVQSGLLYVLWMVASAVIMGGVHHVFFFMGWRVGLQMRASLTALVFSKLLTLGTAASPAGPEPPAPQAAAAGKAKAAAAAAAAPPKPAVDVNNLIGNDVERLSQKIGQFAAFLIIGPVETAVVLYFLWQELGPATLACITMLLLLLLLQMFFSRRFGQLRAGGAQASDGRIQLVGQIIQGIRAIKENSWEQPFSASVREKRTAEVAILRSAVFMKAVNEALFLVAPILIGGAGFVTLHLSDGDLSPRKVFTSLALINLMQLMVTKFVPMAAEAVAEGAIAVGRLERFLQQPEAQCSDSEAIRFEHVRAPAGLDVLRAQEEAPQAPQEASVQGGTSSPAPELTAINGVQGGNLSNPVQKSQSQAGLTQVPCFSAAGNAPVLSLTGLSASWGAGTWSEGGGPGNAAAAKMRECPTLQGVNMRVLPGQLHMIAGRVGSGKSSLLAALLGELPAMTGTRELQPGVVCSFCPQAAWVMSGTFKFNIVLGKQLCSELYERVLDTCCLRRDLSLMERGDMTALGEKGVNLSGGQKARLNLARAVYQVLLPLYQSPTEGGGALAAAGVLLLDDPLAAVDTHVAKSLFEGCIRGTLLQHGVSVVLATHQVQFAHAADVLHVLSGGVLAASGPPADLLSQRVVDEHGAQDSAQMAVETSSAHADVAAVLSRVHVTGDSGGEGGGSDDQDVADLDDIAVSEGEEGSGDVKKPENEGGVLVAQEGGGAGIVTIHTYADYFRAGGGWIVLIYCIVLVLVGQASFFVTQWWLSEWAAASPIEQRESHWLGTFLALVCVTFASGLLRSSLFFFACLAASSTLHNVSFSNVLRAPQWWFDSNPYVICRCVAFLQAIFSVCFIYLQVWSHHQPPSQRCGHSGRHFARSVS